jgi:hypothetical protein
MRLCRLFEEEAGTDLQGQLACSQPGEQVIRAGLQRLARFDKIPQSGTDEGNGPSLQ